ncbi:DNA-processing protein DprA [Jeotgalibacillus sp. R-1-5s-1]|uniref:DNA-processing protein DprA n=1 Tax=Jeotgalibacillus sp. R-1-5s-1 TaxID=2555897 RepID=UPI00106BD045|nr:DNA-processing protein DprA [Jeotgalibacillus sp. R-1-5s-1]TFE03510.1 DNA-protecting protein DprA [Jeotgalibacillus sp. R-1-5s-1]
MYPKSFYENVVYIHYSQIFSNQQLLKWLRSDPLFDHPLRPPAEIQFTAQQIENLHQYTQKHSPQDILNHLSSCHASFITIYDEIYPNQLREIYDAPALLYVKGDSGHLSSPAMLGVVGARKADEYSARALRQIIPELLSKGICIVSGLAAGADGAAHVAALSGKTIGVMGSGFSHQYPSSNEALYKKMEQDQLILSEYPPYQKPARHHFPMRNRIIAGLSKGIFVTQAALKSGSMITVDRALEEGRDIFALPGSVFHPLSAGTNFLIKSGAKPVVSAADIFEEWF